jgi:hypothetical protein
MSKLARTLVLGAMLAAMNLAGMTAVAQAQANDEGKDARRPPTERQVGESWHQPQVASQEQTAADAALRRQLARERFSTPSGTPAQAPAPEPVEPSGQPGWLVPLLAVLAAALAVSGGLAVMAPPSGQAAGFGPATPDPRPPTLSDGAAAPTRQPHRQSIKLQTASGDLRTVKRSPTAVRRWRIALGSEKLLGFGRSAVQDGCGGRGRS